MTLKPDNIVEGVVSVGEFEIRIFRCPFEKANIGNEKFFELCLTERDNYINLLSDQRFDWFGPITRFERTMIDSDMIEFNHYVNRKTLQMLDWKLSRYSISRLFDLCEAIEKQKKRDKKKK